MLATARHAGRALGHQVHACRDPCALVRLALHACQALAHDTRYELDSAYWHSGTTEQWLGLQRRERAHAGRCRIGLAGALIARHSPSAPRERISPSCFDARSEALLRCVDSAALGALHEALYHWHGPVFGVHAARPAHATPIHFGRTNRVPWGPAVHDALRERAQTLSLHTPPPPRPGSTP